MSTALVIRIIGGVCGGAIGTYISGKIYDYINRKPQLPSPPIPEPPKNFENKIKDVKSFQDILNIQIKEHIENRNNNYEYDNEHGNSVEIKNIVKEKECLFVNDSIYDNNYEDYYTILCSLARENN